MPDSLRDYSCPNSSSVDRIHCYPGSTTDAPAYVKPESFEVEKRNERQEVTFEFENATGGELMFNPNRWRLYRHSDERNAWRRVDDTPYDYVAVTIGESDVFEYRVFFSAAPEVEYDTHNVDHVIERSGVYSLMIVLELEDDTVGTSVVFEYG